MINDYPDLEIFVDIQIQSMFRRGMMSIWSLWKGIGLLPQDYDPWEHRHEWI